MTTPDVTLSDLSLPNVTPKRGSDSPRASTRARARLPVTLRDFNPVTWARNIARVAGEDFTRCWVWHHAPPTAAQIKSSPPDVADGPAWFWTSYRYAVAIPASLLCDSIKWMFQHPLRLLITLIVAIPIAATLTLGS